MSKTFPGEPYATEWLVTDTIAYDVVSHTAKTITVRRRRGGAQTRLDPNADQGPYPVVLHSTESDAQAPCHVLRLRKDGTFRRSPNSNPLSFTDNPPETRTDFRF